MDEKPTRKLTNSEYYEYLKLKKRYGGPRRGNWILLGIVIGAALTLLLVLLLFNFRAFWFI